MPTWKHDNHFKLTLDSIKKRCSPPEEGTRAFYWDTEIKGFGLIVGPPNSHGESTRSFILQKDVRGRSVRVTLGRLGDITLDQARGLAHEQVPVMRRGKNPNAIAREEAARGITLEEAIEMHTKAMRAKHANERSVATVREEIERHLSDWLARPLAEIKKNDCATRHERITENAGPYAANRVFALFRACYNTAAKRLDDMPPTPVRGVTFNKTRRRREPIPWPSLPEWRRKVEAIENPVRRDLQLFILLTGLRNEDARTVRWEHVNFEAGTLHRPKPKGGEDRAFTVPVAREVLDLLRRRREENTMLYPDDCGWAFPSKDREGNVTHIREAKEQRYAREKPGGKLRKVEYLPSPHRLRDTFATAAHEARVHPLDLKVLMNHTLPASDDVTEGYIRPSVEHLRGAAEAVAAFLRSRMGRAA